jgi:hypothetical protein
VGRRAEEMQDESSKTIARNVLDSNAWTSVLAYLHLLCLRSKSSTDYETYLKKINFNVFHPKLTTKTVSDAGIASPLHGSTDQ